MQYLRVFLVALTVCLVGRTWATAAAPGAVPDPSWFPPIRWHPFLATLATAVGGLILGRLSRIPAGTILGPMILGAGVRAADLVTIELPPWLLAASYALMGWAIGLKFTRPILRHAARALPQTILAILALIAICATLAFLLATFLGIDPLTAYLATSPGGIDSIAIIAASTRVDLTFVMALQLIRVAVVLTLGPPVSRLVARSLGGEQKPGPEAEHSRSP